MQIMLKFGQAWVGRVELEDNKWSGGTVGKPLICPHSHSIIFLHQFSLLVKCIFLIWSVCWDYLHWLTA